MKRKYLIYGGIGVAVLIAIYYATKSPDKPTPTSEDVTPTEGSPTLSDEKTKEQIALDPKLVSVIKLADDKNKTNYLKSIVNKKIYSKVDNVKLRENYYVNNGLINNIYGQVDKKNTLIGTIQLPWVDKEGAINPVTKKPYNWFSVTLDDALFQDIEKNQKYFYNRKWVKPVVYVREDAIKL